MDELQNLNSWQCGHPEEKNSCHVLSPGIKVATGCRCSQALSFEGGNCPTAIPPGSSTLCCRENPIRALPDWAHWFCPNGYGLSARPWPPSKCTEEKRQHIFFSHQASSLIYYFTWWPGQPPINMIQPVWETGWRSREYCCSASQMIDSETPHKECFREKKIGTATNCRQRWIFLSAHITADLSPCLLDIFQ